MRMPQRVLHPMITHNHFINITYVSILPVFYVFLCCIYFFPHLSVDKEAKKHKISGHVLSFRLSLSLFLSLSLSLSLSRLSLSPPPISL